MRTKVKGLIREEAGAALVLTLVLLLIGGLIIAPLLGHMGTGHTAGQVHEKRMDELYAADAGVEYAIWTITHNGTAPTESLDVNGKAVGVDIDDSQSRRWHITSTAITEGVDGPVSSTTVTADLRSVCMADNAITSRENVNLGNHVSVEGTIQYGGDLDTKIHSMYDEDKIIHETYANWPDSDDLYDYYYSTYVQGKTFVNYHPDDHEIGNLGTKENPLVIESTYAARDLTIKGSGWIRLAGTTYVDGTLHINPTQGGQGIHVILDAQTVFTEGSIYFGTGGKGINLYGSGSFIAVDWINFQPSASSEDGYVLVLSLTGHVNFQPTGGDFHGFIMSVEQYVNFQPQPGFGTVYGSVAGNLNVELKSQVTIEHVSMLVLDIDFPFDLFSMWRLRSYSIHTETG